MTDYRITSSTFVAEGESLETDTVLSLEDQAVIASVTSASKLDMFLKSRVADRMADKIPTEEIIDIEVEGTDGN